MDSAGAITITPAPLDIFLFRSAEVYKLFLQCFSLPNTVGFFWFCFLFPWLRVDGVYQTDEFE